MQSATCFTLRKEQGMHTNLRALIHHPKAHVERIYRGMPSPLIWATHAFTRSSDMSGWLSSSHARPARAIAPHQYGEGARRGLRAAQARLRRTNELVALHGLGLHVVVALGRPRADDLGALVGEAGLQLVHGVAEVVAVAALVAQAEDGHLLALEVEAGQVAVDEPARERVRMSDRPTNGAGKLRQQGVARTRPTRCPSAPSPRRCARWARQR